MLGSLSFRNETGVGGDQELVETEAILEHPEVDGMLTRAVNSQDCALPRMFLWVFG